MGLFSSLFKQKQPVNDKKTTITRLIEKAEHGDVESMLALGKEYRNGATEMGITLQESRETAVKWLERAALMNNAEAMRLLGDLYNPMLAINVRKDPATALKWYDMACMAGDRKACAYAGRFLMGIDGVAKDYHKAAAFFELGANDNNRECMQLLGRMYELGQGRPKNVQKAFALYSKAASLGDPFAELYLGDMYYYGKCISVNYEEAAFHYKVAKGKNVGDAEAMLDLMMLRGETPLVGTENDVFRHLLRLSEGFSSDRGGYILGTFFETGFGVDIDYDRAVAYYEKSANAGNTDSMQRLCVLEMLDWPGHEPNYEKAAYWDRKRKDILG